ncbi:MAG TPA: four helix bundle protein [Candidatus Paceibacterota bacterium]
MEHKESFHEKLRALMDTYVHAVYDATKKFPQDELFGATSQLKRSALSVVLNYIEGYARQQKNTYRHFLEISYGSLKESQYLVEFSRQRGYISAVICKDILQYGEEIGAMLWSTISKMK